MKLDNPRLNKVAEDIIKDTKTTNSIMKQIIRNNVLIAFHLGGKEEIKRAIKKLEDK